MDSLEDDQPVHVTCHGMDPEPYRCRVTQPEASGTYCFPPIASLIPACARLMLMMLEGCVTELGGTYAMEDTDSKVIVATERGGLVPCVGGPHRMGDGSDAVRALSWTQVDSIVERFKAISPYDRDAIPGSILKIEDDNFELSTRKQRQLWCLAISGKRYALFLRDQNGESNLLRKGVNNATDHWSQHGLGHLLNPTNLDADDRAWIGVHWLGMIRRSRTCRPSPSASRGEFP